MTIAFPGYGFSGWQVQDHCRTAQGELTRILRKLLGEPALRTIGSSRTDSGVHAHDLHVSFETASPIPIDGLLRTLNHRLPGDLRALAARERSDRFSARHHALGKHYSYFIYNREKCSPFLTPYVWEYPFILDLEKMRRAAELFVGSRCFHALQSRKDKRETSTTTIFQTRMGRVGDIYHFDVLGHFFLYRMVRNMVACLVRVGCGEWTAEQFARRLDSGERSNLWITAPAKGLHLFKVFYDTEPDGFSDLSQQFLAGMNGTHPLPDSSGPPRVWRAGQDLGDRRDRNSPEDDPFFTARTDTAVPTADS